MKYIAIFGAASAIAEATAKKLLKKDTTFVLIDKNEDRLQAVANDLKTRGAIAHTRAIDLIDTKNHPSLIKDITKIIPTIDLVFIAYGTLGDQKKAEADISVTEQELLINLLSPISLLTLLANKLEEQGSGTIAVISSVAGDRGRQSNYVYGTAKGGLTVFLQGLRNRLAKKGVHVVTIKPGFVDTPMTASFKKGLLWANPATVAKGIIRGIQMKKNVVYVPWFWRYILLIIKLIPEKIFKRLSL